MARSKIFGMWSGVVTFVLILISGWFIPLPEGLTSVGLKMLAVVALMAVWWVTEAVPIPVTSLLPIALFPALGIMKTADVTPAYGHHIIYLFLGGFIIARGIEKWNLHKRLALHIILMFGTAPERIILGFMVATAFLSMWVSNTATTMMMLPIAVSVLSGFEGEEKALPESSMGTALMLGIAFAASIGGLGTLIGTPPNALLAALLEQQYSQHISFAQWMMFGTPLAVIFLFLAWFMLTRLVFRTNKNQILSEKTTLRVQLTSLGPVSSAEKRVSILFGLVALAWISRGFFHFALINDSSIAISGAIALFIIPSGDKKAKFLMDWHTAVTIPWGVLVLFGGGLALAAGLKHTGLVDWISHLLAQVHTTSFVLLVLLAVSLGIVLTELTSNTATASLLIPLAGSTAVALKLHPYLLMIPACVATSYAFMLPVATPPNAVVFGSGRVTIPQMATAGLWLNVAGSVLILFFTLVVLPFLWGIDLSQLPVWAQ